MPPKLQELYQRNDPRANDVSDRVLMALLQGWANGEDTTACMHFVATVSDWLMRQPDYKPEINSTDLVHCKLDRLAALVDLEGEHGDKDREELRMIAEVDTAVGPCRQFYRDATGYRGR